MFTIQLEAENNITHWSEGNLTVPDITLSQQILYDINLDNQTDVSDIVITVDIIMNGTILGSFRRSLIDSNRDDEIDILDIIIILNYILIN